MFLDSLTISSDWRFLNFLIKLSSRLSVILANKIQGIRADIILSQKKIVHVLNRDQTIFQIERHYHQMFISSLQKHDCGRTKLG